MHSIKTSLWVAAMAMWGSAVAAPPVIVTQGNGSAAACAGCHGLDGSGNAAQGAAVLAQLPPAYFIKQLNDFKSGARSHPVMTSIAEALNAEEIAAAAKYYAGLPRPKILSGAESSETASTDLARGENLALNGSWDRQMPACFKCHGDNGQGVPPAFPPIAGQHTTYTVNQLQAWKTGARSNDPQMLMKAVAEKLTFEEIQAVAEYLASAGTAGHAQSNIVQSNVTQSSAPKSNDDPKKAAPLPFVPPAESTIPKNEFGEMVLMGKNIFVDTQQYAKPFIGNGLNCANCHLDNGRKADSAPLWAAYVLYPAYRKKTGQVDTIQSRIQGCFLYSMNGKPPALDSKEMTALVTYHYWLASGAPTGVKLPGQGFVKVPKPSQKLDLARGEEVYKNNCAICHGENGQGTPAQVTKANGKYAFPPLWGKDSFNWGAGMHRVDTAAGFIKANMPYGRGGTLSDQEAWDVALFMNSHERPKDPRFKGSTARTRDKEHDEICLYGRTPDELMQLLDKQATAKPASGKAEDASQQGKGSARGYSPAVAH